MGKYKIEKESNPYIELENLKLNHPFTFEPNIKSEDRISVSKIEIAELNIISTIVKKRIGRQLAKLVSKTMLVLTKDDNEDDEDDGTDLKEALDEAAKFHAMLAYKYKLYLEREYEKEQQQKLAKIVEELKKKRIREKTESSELTSNKGR